jgi:hypothetical protein
MDDRKKLVQEYKERKKVGGVYTITNTVNGKCLLRHAVDLAAAQNLFTFGVATGSCMRHELKQDWEEYGAKAFAFAILEKIEIKPDQSPSAFLQDLQTLEQLWREKLSVEKAY